MLYNNITNNIYSNSHIIGLISFIKCNLTALYVEVAHRRVEGEDGEVALAVEDEVPPHGVHHRPVPEYPHRHLRGVDGLLDNKHYNFVFQQIRF